MIKKHACTFIYHKSKGFFAHLKKVFPNQWNTPGYFIVLTECYPRVIDSVLLCIGMMPNLL